MVGLFWDLLMACFCRWLYAMDLVHVGLSVIVVVLAMDLLAVVFLRLFELLLFD